MKKTNLVVATALATAAMAFTAWGGQWMQNATGWWYDYGNGTWPASSWQWIDGNNDGIAECYYFDQYGYMAANTTTPDGYRVDESGAWVDESGNQYFEAGKGISSTRTVDITGGTAGPGGSSGGSSTSGKGSSESRDNSVSYAANDFKQGNYSKMSADERADVADAIVDFKAEHITDGMSDFEKEIKIIEWLVENCEYQKADDW